MGPFWKNGRFWLAVAICAVLLSMAFYSGRARPPIMAARGLLVRASAPVAAWFSGAGFAIDGAVATVAHWAALPRENARLTKENNQLRLLATQNEELRQENEQLRTLLGLPLRRAGYAAQGGIAARVIERDPSSWYDDVVVNRGAAEGVRRGMAAVVGDGLAGRVSQVLPHQSVVLLLTSPDSGVGALVQRQTSRAQGVVLGTTGSSDRLRMSFFSRDADVVEGDLVVSSGLGGAFPAGIPIGQVVAVVQAQQGLVKDAELQPAAKLDRVEWVMLVAETGGTTSAGASAGTASEASPAGQAPSS